MKADDAVVMINELHVMRLISTSDLLFCLEEDLEISLEGLNTNALSRLG